MKILRNYVSTVFGSGLAESFASDGQINLRVFSLTFSGQRGAINTHFSYSSPLNDWEWLCLFPFMLFQVPFQLPEHFHTKTDRMWCVQSSDSFVPPGGVPLLSDPAHQKLISFLKEIPSKLHQPDLILVISAHWEESTRSIGTGKFLLYDYWIPGGSLPDQYPVPGSEEKALDLVSVLEKQVFLVLSIKTGDTIMESMSHWLMYPEANIPVIGISLMKSLDQKQHLDLGAALSPYLKKTFSSWAPGFPS